MKKKLNKLIYSSIVTSIFFVIIGFVLIINPKMSLGILSYLVSAFLIISGILLFITDLRYGNTLIFFDNVLTGTLSLILGILLLINPKTLSYLIPIVFGIWLVLTSVSKLRFSTFLEGTTKLISIIISIITIICGMILILRPTFGALTVILVTGIVLVVYSVIDIIDMVIFKKHIDDIEKRFKKIFDFIEMD